MQRGNICSEPGGGSVGFRRQALRWLELKKTCSAARLDLNATVNKALSYRHYRYPTLTPTSSLPLALHITLILSLREGEYSIRRWKHASENLPLDTLALELALLDDPELLCALASFTEQGTKLLQNLHPDPKSLCLQASL